MKKVRFNAIMKKIEFGSDCSCLMIFKLDAICPETPFCTAWIRA